MTKQEKLNEIATLTATVSVLNVTGEKVATQKVVEKILKLVEKL